MSKPLTALQILGVNHLNGYVPPHASARTEVAKDKDPAGALDSPLDTRRGGATVTLDTSLAPVPNTGRGSGQAFTGPSLIRRG